MVYWDEEQARRVLGNVGYAVSIPWFLALALAITLGYQKTAPPIVEVQVVVDTVYVEGCETLATFDAPEMTQRVVMLGCPQEEDG